LVTLNGLVLDGAADYTATTGSSIVLAAPSTLNDELNVVAFEGVVPSGALPLAGGTITGSLVVDSNVSIGGNLTVGGNLPVPAYNSIGSYVFAFKTTSGAIIQNSSYSGSILKPGGICRSSDFTDDSQQDILGTKGGTTLSGTWRAMGRNNSASYPYGWTLFVRIV